MFAVTVVAAVAPVLVARTVNPAAVWESAASATVPESEIAVMVTV
jgi:hypothetical protein